MAKCLPGRFIKMLSKQNRYSIVLLYPPENSPYIISIQKPDRAQGDLTNVDFDFSHISLWKERSILGFLNSICYSKHKINVESFIAADDQLIKDDILSLPLFQSCNLYNP